MLVAFFIVIFKGVITIYYSKIQFVSGKERDVVFADYDEAIEFYNQALKENITRIEVNDNDNPLIININNVESISKPVEYIMQ